MKLQFPKSLPFISGAFGLSAGAAYYLSIMISQFFIGRPSSTWLLGVFYVPILILKPAIIAFVLGWALRLILARFYEQHEITAHRKRILKIILITVMACSALAGTWKIYRLNKSVELERKTTTYIQQGLTLIRPTSVKRKSDPDRK